VPVVGTNHFVPENMLPHAPGVLLRSAATGRLIRRALWRQLARFYERLDAVTFPSRAAAELATRWGMRAAAHVISNGIDVSRFRPAPAGAPGPGPRRPASPVILYVGRLDPDKGLETLVRAMPWVRSRDAADLVLCGTGVAAPALRRLARASGVAEAIRFIGFVDDERLPELYRAATVFAMPSANELQSLATLEAMASGLPVVAADALALPELVRPDDNGLLFPAGDHRALGDRIVRLLSDPAARSRMGSAARATAERHRIETTLDAFERLYRDLAAGPDPGEQRMLPPRTAAPG
jgi:glycosyltransferase involved in cell wall biosynthesis